METNSFVIEILILINDNDIEMKAVTLNDGISFKFNGLMTKNFDGNFLSGQRGMLIITFAVYFIWPNSLENDDGRSSGKVHAKL